MTAVVALHGVVAALLLSMDVIKLPSPLATLMVEMIPASPPPAPEITPPRPKQPTPQVKPQPRLQPQPTPPVMAAQTAAPTASEAPPPPEKPAPAVPVPAAVSVSEPRFDADYLDNPAPVYPPLSRRLGEEGKVFLRVFVGPDGRPGQILIRTSSGSERLDRAAEQAVWRWKFVPARRGEEAVGAWVVVPIAFSLKG